MTIGEKQKQQQSIRFITILSLCRTVYLLGIVQRNAKDIPSVKVCVKVYYCHKVFQTSNIESEIKSKRKHLSCSLPLLYMAYSMKKQLNTPFDFQSV
jgi:hypothetical protein